MIAIVVHIMLQVCTNVNDQLIQAFSNHNYF